MRDSVRSIASGISGAIVLLGLALAFALGGFNLPVFFVALAFAVLVGSFGSLNPRGVFGALYGFFGLLILALYFATHSWLWFLVGAAIATLLSALAKPITALILSIGIFGMVSVANRQQQHPYQSSQQGYSPPAAETYQEGGLEYRSPQQMPPQQ